MRYASIDIGTNTLRLLIAEPGDDGRLKPLIYKRMITRLGGGYREAFGIDPASAERTFAALESFRVSLADAGVKQASACATSVVRRAKNRDWFTEEVFKRTGIKVSVISGDDEARLSLAGVLSVLNDRSGKKLVIDIGGGSTEFIATSGDGIAGAWSMEMGVVHLSEAHIKSDPPEKAELACLEAEIKGVLAGLEKRMRADTAEPSQYSARSGAVLVGTAGTITTLAAMDQELDFYDREKINNYTLKRERVRDMYSYLCSLTLKQRQEVLTLEKGREDLIIPGAAITLSVMDEFGFDGIKVSDAGLLEGIILKKAGAGQIVQGYKNRV